VAPSARLNRVAAALAALAGRLDAHRHAWALVGGLAVGARAEPRTTRDVDVAIAVDDDRAAERVVFELGHAGYRVDATIEHTKTGRLATARLRGAEDPRVLIDLLFASAGIEPEVVAHAERIRVASGLVVPVASIGHLVAMKVLARDDRRRPQDADDLRNLLAVATASDRRVARRAVRLIEERGYARRRNLSRRLEVAIEENDR
jgi:predicted nucleotidyltransferase